MRSDLQRKGGLQTTTVQDLLIERGKGDFRLKGVWSGLHGENCTCRAKDSVEAIVYI